MPPQAKRRRRQSSVLSFFQPDPPTPPSIPSPTPLSIPSAPPSASTASPVKPCSIPAETDDTPLSAVQHDFSLVISDKPFSVCTLSSVCVDVIPAPAALSVCTLPGMQVASIVGSPVTPEGVRNIQRFDCKEEHADEIEVDEIEETDDEHDDDEDEDEDEDGEDEDDWQPISRLSHSRNVARRSARLRAVKQEEEERHDNNSATRTFTPEALTTPISSSTDRSPKETAAAAATSVVKSRPSSPKQRSAHPFFTSKDVDIAKPPQQKKLHPFFAATVAAVSNAKDRKRPRPVALSADAWQCPSATVHVNAPQPLGTFHWRKGVTQPIRPTSSVAPVEFSYYTAKTAAELRPVENMPCENADTWAERYKRDRRIDVINGAATKELVDWLRNWYETRDHTEISEDSQDSYIMPNEVGDKERVAIVTGPVGCGKSTMIANAARQLGLSILEINASVCRTGKRIREIIGEALSTHRVTHRSVFQTFKATVEPAAKTLILFEEVDELHDDEKGFWSTIQKLAASSDCRRPIVCTANSFTSQMRQFFIQSRATFEEDFDRLLLKSRMEQLVNPIEYKLIEFQSRSERQATAVINRVCSTERAEAVNDVANCLAVTSSNDTRKAINLLHLWGAEGLVHNFASSPRRTRGSPPKRGRHGRLSEETQGRIGIALVKAADPGDHAVSTFHVGSLNYTNFRSKGRNSPSKANNSIHFDEALDTWCTSLEAMSDADIMEGTAERERLRRNFELSKEPFDVCMDTDIQQAAETAREINALSLQYSASYLRFGRGAQHVNDIAKEAANVRCTPRNYFSSHLPLPRRPISLEYLPILRTMALAAEKGCSGLGFGGDGLDRPMRRTRARARQGGFWSLDLDPITILTLKRTAIRTNES